MLKEITTDKANRTLVVLLPSWVDMYGIPCTCSLGYLVYKESIHVDKGNVALLCWQTPESLLACQRPCSSSSSSFTSSPFFSPVDSAVVVVVVYIDAKQDGTYNPSSDG